MMTAEVETETGIETGIEIETQGLADILTEGFCNQYSNDNLTFFQQF
jgi:hypothetical protein